MREKTRPKAPTLYHITRVKNMNELSVDLGNFDRFVKVIYDNKIINVLINNVMIAHLLNNGPCVVQILIYAGANAASTSAPTN